MIDIIPVVDLDKFQKPVKKTEGSAAYDVFATSRRWTPDYIEYGLGFRTDMPFHVKGEIKPRSSISKYDLIMCNAPGLIDSDYKNEWLVRFKHLTTKAIDLKGASEEIVNQILDEEKVYKVGDRVAQVEFMYRDDLDVSNVIVESNERNGGFGSTGA